MSEDAKNDFWVSDAVPSGEIIQVASTADLQILRRRSGRVLAMVGAGELWAFDPTSTAAASSTVIVPAYFSPALSGLGRWHAAVAGTSSLPAINARVGLRTPECVLYLENGSGMSNSGGFITSWTNQANGAAPGVPGTAAPAYEAAGFNGHPCINLTAASSHELACDAIAASVSGAGVPFALVAAVQITSVANLKTMFSFTRNSDGNPLAYLRTSTIGTFELVYRTDAGALSDSVTTTVPNTSRHIVTWLVNGGGSRCMHLRVDGTMVREFPPVSAATVTFDRFGIGSFRASTVSGFTDMRVAELCVIAGRTVSGFEMERIEADMGRLLV